MNTLRRTPPQSIGLRSFLSVPTRATVPPLSSLLNKVFLPIGLQLTGCFVFVCGFFASFWVKLWRLRVKIPGDTQIRLSATYNQVTVKVCEITFDLSAFCQKASLAESLFWHFYSWQEIQRCYIFSLQTSIPCNSGKKTESHTKYYRWKSHYQLRHIQLPVSKIFTDRLCTSKLFFLWWPRFPLSILDMQYCLPYVVTRGSSISLACMLIYNNDLDLSIITEFFPWQIITTTTLHPYKWGIFLDNSGISRHPSSPLNQVYDMWFIIERWLLLLLLLEFIHVFIPCIYYTMLRHNKLLNTYAVTVVDHLDPAKSILTYFS